MIGVRDLAEIRKSDVPAHAGRPADSLQEGFIHWDPCLGMSPVLIAAPAQFVVPHLVVFAACLLVLFFFV